MVCSGQQQMSLNWSVWLDTMRAKEARALH